MAQLADAAIESFARRPGDPICVVEVGAKATHSLGRPLQLPPQVGFSVDPTCTYAPRPGASGAAKRKRACRKTRSVTGKKAGAAARREEARAARRRSYAARRRGRGVSRVRPGATGAGAGSLLLGAGGMLPGVGEKTLAALGAGLHLRRSSPRPACGRPGPPAAPAIPEATYVRPASR